MGIFWRRRPVAVKWTVGFLIIIGLILSGFHLYRILAEDSYAQGLKYLKNFEEAMSGDTVGGKNPEETLKLFITALKAGDMKLASLFFILNDLGERETKFITALKRVQAEGLLTEMISKLEGAEPNPQDAIGPGDFKYVIRGGDGRVEATVNLEFNKFSGVWKIESL